MINRSIFLVGFMGCGKTTIGGALAARLGLDFVDLDELVVEQAGRSIPEIFSESGEPHFRELEQEALKSLAERAPLVVALGGGAYVSDENHLIVVKQGVAIWLNCSLEKTIERLGDDKSRPLYSERSPEELASLLEERMPSYIRADLRVDVTDMSVEETVERIVSLLMVQDR